MVLGAVGRSGERFQPDFPVLFVTSDEGVDPLPGDTVFAGDFGFAEALLDDGKDDDT